MALFNHATKEVTAKLVYYGPGLCGKTTNLQWLHEKTLFSSKGKLVSLATETDRTLFFDFFSAELGTIRGMKTRIHLYTVPGQIFYEATRRMVLKGADAVVFVADSQKAALEANLESLESLWRNLAENEIDPAIPMVLQYNKRDLPTALPVSLLNAKLNPRHLPAYEAVAIWGVGVDETLKAITKLLLRSLSAIYESGYAQPRSAGSTTEVHAGAAVAPSSAADLALEEAPLTLEDPDAAPRPGPAVEALAPAVPAAAPAARKAVSVGPAAAEEPPLPSGLAPEEWVYFHHGKQHGPIDLDDLIDLVLTSAPEDTKVWRPGLAVWTEANLAPEIAEHIPPPLPITPRAGMGVEAEEDFPDFNTVPAMLRTALIADEDPDFRKRLGMPLAAQGFTVYQAADGAQAWQLALQHHPRLILADVSMPEVDGFEFCRRVREHALLSHTPLVFVSGSDKYKERYRALQIGAQDFLSKQTPVRELLIRIQLLMTRYSDLVAGEKQPGAGPSVEGALKGQLEVFGAPGVLQICNQGRLTGMFTARAGDARSGPRLAVFGFRDGEIISAITEEIKGPEAVYAFLTWTTGQFDFAPGDPGEGAPIAQSVEHLLLEGCRLMDEATRGPEAASPASPGTSA